MMLTWTYTTLDNLPAVNVLSDSGELGPGQCGGQSCRPEYENMLAAIHPPLFCGPAKKHPNRECGGGHRVIRSTKSFT